MYLLFFFKKVYQAMPSIFSRSTRYSPGCQLSAGTKVPIVLNVSVWAHMGGASRGHGLSGVMAA